MTTRNPITGDEIKSKINTKEYEDNYDRIFKRKPQSLDAAYERRAMMQGLVVNPLFEENKELWTEADEKRMDVVGTNGNEGLHYEENKD